MNTNRVNKETDNNCAAEAVIKPLNAKPFERSGEQLSPSHERSSNQDAQLIARETSPAHSRKRGGPRTPQGKQKSKRNALKHGIFSRTVLLKGESRAKYNALLKSFMDQFAPEGALEAFFVSMIVDNLWRRHRISIAAEAENRRVTEFLEWDEKCRQDVEAASISDMEIEAHRLMGKIANPRVLKAFLDQLKLLRGRIREVGFDEKTDRSILIRLYGMAGPVTGESTLFDIYLHCLYATPPEPTVGEQEEAFGPEDRKIVFLKVVEAEIGRLERYEKKQSQIESRRISVETLCSSIPDSPHLERFLRYEAHLDRNFDRLMNHLERLQRFRKGEPSTPTVNVNLVQ